MTNFIRPILAVLTIAGATHVLTGCSDWDDAMRIAEGKPTKEQVAYEAMAAPAADAPKAALVADVSVEAVEEVAVLPVVEPKPECRPVFRVSWCDDDGVEQFY